MTKKQLLLAVMALWLALPTMAQPGITIGLVIPQNSMNLDSETYSILRTKLQQIMTRGGVSTLGGDIIAYPTVNVANQQTIEGGMRTLYSVDVDLTLTVVERFTNKMFASETFTIVGSGSRKVSEAVLNAIVSIQPGDREYQNFVANAKQQISNYYVTNRSALIAKAKNLAAMNRNEEAVALLYSYPAELDGASEVQSTLLSIYKQYKKNQCNELIQHARGAIAQQDYETALDYLVEVDADGACGSEAQKLIKQVNGKVEEGVQRYEQKLEADKQREHDLAKHEWNAIADMVTAYYQRTWPNVTYQPTQGGNTRLNVNQ